MNEEIYKLAAVVAQMVLEFGWEGPNGPTGESWWDSKDYEKVATFLYEKGVRA